MEITRTIIEYTSEAEWLAARARDITSTEAAGLFNAGIYENARTQYELFHIKSGILTPAPFEASDRTRWGNRLESAIAHGIAEDLGLIVAPFKCYMRIPELRMGSSFDFKVVGVVEDHPIDNQARAMFRQHGEGILEIKNVDGLAFRRSWMEDGETIEAPPHIEFQVAHQLEVSGLNWAIIAPLVGGNTPKVVIRERDEAIGNALRLAAGEFWSHVEAGVAPAPVFERDGDTIGRLYVNTGADVLDMSANNRLVELCMVRKQAADAIKEAEKVKDAATAEILTIIGDAKKVTAAGGFTISASTIEPKWIEAYERKGYRTIRINQKAA